MAYNQIKLTGKNGKKVFKKAAKAQIKAVKKGTKVQNVKNPGGKASKIPQAQNGTFNKKISKAAPSTTTKKFQTSDYFDPQAGPLGGFRGFTEKK